MKTIPPILIFILVSVNSISQNLVPNPSFELYNNLPNKEDNSIYHAKNWIAPKYNSDYYHRSATKRVGVPKNRFGNHEPHSGDAYAGICTTTKYLEYLEAQLIQPLKKDQEYLVELYISKAKWSIGSLKEFGILFLNRPIYVITARGIPIKPQIVFNNPKKYQEKKEWLKLSANYIATGEENVLVFGHFNYDPSDDKRMIFSHYYIDDISVTPVENDSLPGAIPNHVINESQNSDYEIGETMVLKNIFFNTNEAQLLPQSYIELNKLSNYLEETPNTKIEIIGYTDNIGDNNQNMLLSDLRAKAVAEYLKSKGINETRIKYFGKGSLNPVSTNESEDGRQKNRRVEFIIFINK